MRVLVLGADGMLGHQVVRELCSAGHDVVGTTRKPPASLVAQALDGVEVVSGVDARQADTVGHALAVARPEAVVNCIGIVKQRAEAGDAVESIRVNSLFPHQLAILCRVAAARLVHLSTDCVFSGSSGFYTEEDTPDPTDLYGRTKLLGEVAGPGAITLRTSIFGLELERKVSLVEWFLAQDGAVPGWSKARYSGLSTFVLSRLITRLLEDHPDVSGLWHVSSDPIDKHSLLVQLGEFLGRPTEVVPDGSIVIDRSLDSARFRGAVAWEPPSWSTMLSELAAAVHERRAT